MEENQISDAANQPQAEPLEPLLSTMGPRLIEECTRLKAKLHLLQAVKKYFELAQVVFAGRVDSAPDNTKKALTILLGAMDNPIANLRTHYKSKEEPQFKAFIQMLKAVLFQDNKEIKHSLLLKNILVIQLEMKL